MEERRAYPRYPVSLKARAVMEESQKIYEGKVTDISFSGVRFVCDEQINEGQKLQLVLFIENQEVALKAMVVWAKALENLEGIQHGMQVFGVVFEGDRKQLANFFKKIQS